MGWESRAPINSTMGRFGHRVADKLHIDPPLRLNGKPQWWHVPFLSYHRSDGKLPWIMRPELVRAWETLFTPSPSPVFNFGELPSSPDPLPEGRAVRVEVNRYERNKRARQQCLSHHGTSCIVCGFNFEAVYGPMGKDKIHVHHIRPIHKADPEYRVDPIQDLLPVCPNCHLIIHSTNEPLPPDTVKQLLKP